MNTPTGIKLDDATRARLKALGEIKQRSPHWLMKRAIEQYLDAEERYEREKQEDRGRWQRYQASGMFIDDSAMRDRLRKLAATAHNDIDAEQ